MTFWTYQRYFTSDFWCVRIAATRARYMLKIHKRTNIHTNRTQRLQYTSTFIRVKQQQQQQEHCQTSPSSTHTRSPTYHYSRTHKESEDTQTHAHTPTNMEGTASVSDIQLLSRCEANSGDGNTAIVQRMHNRSLLLQSGSRNSNPSQFWSIRR